jgi:hypothetical protein
MARSLKTKFWKFKRRPTNHKCFGYVNSEAVFFRWLLLDVSGLGGGYVHKFHRDRLNPQ